MKLNLIESKKDRESVMNGNLGNDRQIKSLLSGLVKADKVVDYMTEPMVAKFYKVADSTIMNIGNRHKLELSKYGYKTYNNTEIKQLQHSNQVDCFKVPPRGKRLYPLKAVFLIGMMLTESEVAERLREEIISLVFDNRVDLLEVRQDKLEGCICIKKKESVNVTDLMKAHLGIQRINQAKEAYMFLKELIFIHFNVTKFEDIPVTKCTLIELQECFREYDHMLEQGNKQLSYF